MNLFNVLSLGEEAVAHVKLSLPPNIEKGKQYPMLVRVYAGPGTSRVKDAFDLGTVFIIICSIFSILHKIMLQGS